MRVLHAMKEAGLWLAAATGVLCIALFLAAVIGGYTLVMFKTGSMAPGIPAGSLALVHEVPAASIQLGDVVTVDRAGQLPVTHRVVEVVERGEQTQFRMQGDANAEPDLELYSASTVRTMIWSAPGLAVLVAAASQPMVLGLITVAAAVLVTWAFWPRTVRPVRRTASADNSDRDADRDRDHDHAERTARSAGAARTGTLCAAALGAAMLLAEPAGSAQAASWIGEESVVQGEHIVLHTAHSGDAEIRPGRGVPVVFGMALRSPEPEASYRPSLDISGPLSPSLQATVLHCARLDDSKRCGPDAETVAELLPARQLDGLRLAEHAGDTRRWIDVELSLAGSAAPAPQSAQAVVTLRVDGDGAPASHRTTVRADGGQPERMPGALAGTGSAGAPLLLAGTAILLGLGTAALARHRRTRHSDGEG